MNDTFTHTEEDAAIVEDAEKAEIEDRRIQIDMTDFNAAVEDERGKKLGRFISFVRGSELNLGDRSFDEVMGLFDKFYSDKVFQTRLFLMGYAKAEAKFAAEIVTKQVANKPVATIHPDGTQTK